ncbi:MAG: restriction endonuclease subunit S [Chloroflexota bacterium]
MSKSNLLLASDQSQSPQSHPRWRHYPSYADCCVDWLGKIPAHWETRRLKFIAALSYGDSLPSDMREDGCIAVYGSNGPVGLHSSANTVGPALVIGRKGSFGKVNYSPAPCFAIDTTFFVDRRKSTADIRWLFYTLPLLGLDDISSDSAVPGLSREFAHSKVLPYPPISEQRAIAAFLDRETAKLDALIAKKERLIELLQEKRAALISRAVTKGLDPGAPMKDSGVEWLGEIPAHWEVRRLKFAARMESGHTPSRTEPENWISCTIPWVTLNDVGYLKDHDYVWETANYINEHGLASSSARLLPKGTVILSRDATVGRCGILGRTMATSQHFINWICGPDIDNRYLLEVFRGPMQDEFMRLTMGATLRTIGMPDVSEFRMPIPPMSEQRAIIDLLDEEKRTIDELLRKVLGATGLLREYRSSLISAAVTGKIDVREVPL